MLHEEFPGRTRFMLLWGGATLFALAVTAYLIVTAALSLSGHGTEVAGARTGSTVDSTTTEGRSAFVVLRPDVVSSPDNVNHLVGQTVRLERVQALSVVSQAVFWVGLDPSAQILVVRDLSRTMGAIRSVEQVNTGQTVTVTGHLARSTGPAEALPNHAWSPAELGAQRQAQLLLRADEVQAEGR